MIDRLLAVIDALIKIKQRHDRRLNKLFEDLFEPVFNELLLVHSDYLQMFEEIYGLLASGDQNATGKINHATQYLRQRRIEFEPVRVRLRTLAREMLSAEVPSEAQFFVNSVIRYFSTGAVFQVSTASMALLDLLERTSPDEVVSQDSSDDVVFDTEDESERLARRRVDRVLEYVRKLVDEQKKIWSDICEAHASLKVAAAKRP